MTIDCGNFAFHVLIDNSVCYVTLAEKAYPKKLAFQYLEELSNEFSRLYGASVESVTRPYAFIKFGEMRHAFGGDDVECVRYLYSKDKEALCRFTDATESDNAESGAFRSASDYDQEHSGGSGTRRKT